MRSLRSRMIYQYFKRVGSPFDPQAPLEQQRAYLEKQGKLAPLPSKVDIEPVTIAGCYAEWLRPHVASQTDAMLYLHGGGYTMGSCNTHRGMAARIAKACQMPVLMIDYRLAPEHPFPAALEDAFTAYRFLSDQAGLNYGRIFIGGDSAGGGLALALTLKLREESYKLPSGLICISPWADLTMSGETVITCANTDPLISMETSLIHAASYVGKHDPAGILISPVFADLSRFPPLLIQVGEYEILQSDAQRLMEAARRAEVGVTLETWGGMWHVWHGFAGFIPEAQRAIDNIGQFVSNL